MIALLTERPSLGAVVYFGWSCLAKKSSKKSKKKKTVDVLSHILVPKMDIISESEKGKLLKKYSISEDQLPVIQLNDPAAVALKAEPGDVIRISRNGETGEYLAFRVVV